MKINDRKLNTTSNFHSGNKNSTSVDMENKTYTKSRQVLYKNNAHNNTTNNYPLLTTTADIEMDNVEIYNDKEKKDNSDELHLHIGNRTHKVNQDSNYMSQAMKRSEENK